jgi:hypothetical protein
LFGNKAQVFERIQILSGLLTAKRIKIIFLALSKKLKNKSCEVSDKQLKASSFLVRVALVVGIETVLVHRE